MRENGGRYTTASSFEWATWCIGKGAGREKGLLQLSAAAKAEGLVKTDAKHCFRSWRECEEQGAVQGIGDQSYVQQPTSTCVCGGNALTKS